MSHLRHIGVFVDERYPRHFHWVLHESTRTLPFGRRCRRVESLPMWIDYRHVFTMPNEPRGVRL